MHDILLKKLNYEFGVNGSLLDLICNYLSGRQQFTVLNGIRSDLLPVSIGIPQGSVLGRALFVLFTNDLPSSVPSGSVYMYADDIIIYCVGETVACVQTSPIAIKEIGDVCTQARETADLAIDQLNKALREFYNWSLNNQLRPHPRKSEVIFFTQGTPMGPIAPVYLRNLGHFPFVRTDRPDHSGPSQ